MLEVFTKVIQGFIMSIYGFIIIKRIIKSETKIITFRSILMITALSILAAQLNNAEYQSLYTISIFALNIIVYKMIFNIKIEESLVACGMLMILTFIGDLSISSVLRLFFSIEEIRSNELLYLLSTTMVSTLGFALLQIKSLLKKLQQFYLNLSENKPLLNKLFLILLIIGLSSIAQNITGYFIFEKEYITNIIIMIIFFALSYLFINSRNDYKELSSQYDGLFTYVQNFEDWIEKEQLNRHEYKNQLAVLRCLTKEKKVKDKIDEILEDSINVEGEVVHQLKSLPKGGLKGLMYYKSAIAQKNKINLTVNISIERNSILNKLSEQDIRVLCKLIGIYFDNAIEAAKETRKKVIMIEIYELKDKVNIVFSNTFKQHKNFKDRNKKGVSSKGEGHGNGLYFASKLIDKNEWLEEKQEVIDKYYIQQLTIKQSK